jgi:hypothetical protein
MAVIMKSAIFWDVTPCGSCKNQHFGGLYHIHHHGDKNRLARNNLAVTRTDIIKEYALMMEDTIFNSCYFT